MGYKKVQEGYVKRKWLYKFRWSLGAFAPNKLKIPKIVWGKPKDPDYIKVRVTIEEAK